MSRYPYEPWTITEDGFQPDNLRESESIFALGNGFIGMRGNLEEQNAAGAESIQGTFLNGVFDSEPIVYGEKAYGYARNHETICNVMDAKSLIMTADGERLDMGMSSVESHRRTLDLRAGVLRRSLLWHTKGGCVLAVESERLVSFTHSERAAARLRITCREGVCSLVLRGGIAPAVIAAGDPEDPRSAAGKDRRLHCNAVYANGALQAMQQRTKNTGYTINCAVMVRTALPVASEIGNGAVSWTSEIKLQAGDSILLDRSICYTASAPGETDQWEETLEKACTSPDFDDLAAEQKIYLENFWDRAGLSITGDDALLQGLRFNLFHLLQSAGRDGKRNIAAKGLSGEGYEGHTFWDTEAYMLPVFLYTEPQLARKLLEQRWTILPKARERAHVMGHPRGALYPWRTIDGEECSAYFPAGTAQFHINGDIAHAVWEYYRATEDLDFLACFGAEMLTETARLYYDLGFFSAEKGGRFVLNCVTGPDEYNVLVNNNVYTNSVAEENFRSAAMSMSILAERCPKDYDRLCGELDFCPEEASRWIEAAERMYYPEARDGIIPQDDGFLEREPWPLESIPPEKHPLLMHYHGLVIYRRMICKQADLILAMTQFGDRYTLEEKKKNFSFYDSVTTHDSSLSMAVFSLLASEIGETDTAYRYFMSSARLDLDNTQGNTKDGLHMANMAGAWIGIVKGFGGMRLRGERLSFAPVCPREWDGYVFRICFRGRTLQVEADHTGARCRLIRGEKITVLLNGDEITLAPESNDEQL